MVIEIKQQCQMKKTVNISVALSPMWVINNMLNDSISNLNLPPLPKSQVQKVVTQTVITIIIIIICTSQLNNQILGVNWVY